MQSVVQYGRLLARAIVTGLNSEYHPRIKSPPQRDLCLVSAASGFGKTFSPAQITKKWRFGDDACFTANHKLGDVIGVADGVGGWREYGIDPSQFPGCLMLTCERMVREGRFRPHAPVEIIAASYYELIENKAPLLGSCTACVVSLQREEKTMYAANLGDSGYLVVREGRVVCRSEEQQHYFNTPFQLAIAPPGQEGLVLSDSPESAERTSFGVQEGDIILVGTDGLFDNMHEEMILQQLAKLKDRKAESIQRTANSIAHLAHQLAFDPDYMSPFAQAANEYGIGIKGGKPDDVTVVLASVESVERSR